MNLLTDVVAEGPTTCPCGRSQESLYNWAVQTGYCEAFEKSTTCDEDGRNAKIQFQACDESEGVGKTEASGHTFSTSI
jgi:hypothetical protein